MIYMDVDIFKSDGSRHYGIIYSDPACSQKKGNLRACRPNQKRELDYQTLSIDEIKKIHEQSEEMTL